MTTHRGGSTKAWAWLDVIGAICLLTGCRSVEVDRLAMEPAFFPPAPAVPRLQFLTSLSGPESFCPRPTSGFERFVLGEPPGRVGIAAPYGMALFDGKLYVCDVGRQTVAVFDLHDRTFRHLTPDTRLVRPVNIFIDDAGWKYVADSGAGVVFVFDRNDNLNTMLGKKLNIKPVDIVVRGAWCYVTDCASNQVVILSKVTGQEIRRIGLTRRTAGQAGLVAELPPGEFSLISDLALDQHGNIYVTDKAGARITQFDSSGVFRRTIGRLGDNIDEFVRPKGIAIDREGRIWVVDAATEVAKIYNESAQLLLFFGLPGNEPGRMNLPATIIVDYDNVSFFRKYAVPEASIEFLVLVSNQRGPHKINVYGFGVFPAPGRATARTATLGS